MWRTDKAKKTLVGEGQSPRSPRRKTELLRKATTKHKRTEEALRQGKGRYRSIFEESPISLWEEDFSDVKIYIEGLRDSGITDIRGYFKEHPEAVAHCADLVKVVDVNKATLELYDAGSIDEFQDGIGAIFSEESYDVFREELFALIDGETKFESEAITRSLKGCKNHIFIKWSVAPGYEKTLSKVLVSVLDITKHKKAEDELRTNEAKLKSIIENMPTVCWKSDQDGRTLFISPNVESVYGYTPEEIYDKSSELFLDRIHPDDKERTLESYEKLFAKNKPFDVEYRIKRKDGKWIWLKDRARRVLDENGTLCTYGAFLDITERKKTEQALRESEEKFRSFVENVNDIIYCLGLDGKFTYVSPNCLDLTGYDASELLGKSYAFLIHPDDLSACDEFLHQVISTGEKQENIEYRVKHKDGSYHWNMSNASALKDKNGNVTAFLGISRDINERKKAEKAKQFSEKVLKILNQNLEKTSMLQKIVDEVHAFTGCAAVGIRILDEKGNIPYEAYRGFDKGFYESETTLSIHSDKCMCINVIKKETDPNMEFYTADGSFYMNKTTRFLNTLSIEERGKTRNICNEFGYESVALIPLKTEEHVFGLLHVADYQENMISESTVKTLENTAKQIGLAIQQLRAKDALSTSEKRYRELVETSQDMIFTMDLKGNLTFVNSAWIKHIGFTLDELQDRNGFSLVHPEDIEHVREVFNNVVFGKYEKNLEFRSMTKKGEYKNVLINGSPIYGSEGNVMSILGTGIDVTELKKTQEDVKRISESLVEAQRIANLGSWNWEIEKNKLSWSEETYRIFGLKHEEFTEDFDGFFKWVHPNDKEFVQKNVEEAISKGKPIDFEHRIVLKNGAEKFIYEKGEITFDEKYKPVRLAGTCLDITERKQTEEELKIFLAAIENALDGIVLTDMAGKVMYFNNSSCQIFGYSPDEMWRLHVKDFSATSETADWLEAELAKNGKFFNEIEGKKKTGERFYAVLTVTVSKELRVYTRSILEFKLRLSAVFFPLHLHVFSYR